MNGMITLFVCGMLCAALDISGHELPPSLWWLLGFLSFAASVAVDKLAGK